MIPSPPARVSRHLSGPQNDYDQVRWIAGEATEAALTEIDRHINTDVSSGVPVVVWNSLGWPRTDLVEATVQMPRGNDNEPSVLDVDGKVLPAQLLSRDETAYLMERPEGKPLQVSGDQIVVPVTPYSINTVRSCPTKPGTKISGIHRNRRPGALRLNSLAARARS